MTDVSKVSAINSIRTLMVDPVNALVVWTLQNDPTGTAITEVIPRTLTTDLASGNTVATAPLTTALTAVELNRIELIDLIRSTAAALTVARQVRLLKQNYPYTSAYSDVTAVAHMTNSFGLSIVSMPYPDLGVLNGTVELADLNNYLATLSGVVAAWRNTVQTYTENYCHSNCHSNCHGNRGRR